MMRNKLLTTTSKQETHISALATYLSPTLWVIMIPTSSLRSNSWFSTSMKSLYSAVKHAPDSGSSLNLSTPGTEIWGGSSTRATATTLQMVLTPLQKFYHAISTESAFWNGGTPHLEVSIGCMLSIRITHLTSKDSTSWHRWKRLRMKDRKLDNISTTFALSSATVDTSTHMILPVSMPILRSMRYWRGRFQSCLCLDLSQLQLLYCWLQPIYSWR